MGRLLAAAGVFSLLGATAIAHADAAPASAGVATANPAAVAPHRRALPWRSPFVAAVGAGEAWRGCFGGTPLLGAARAFAVLDRELAHGGVHVRHRDVTVGAAPGWTPSDARRPPLDGVDPVRGVAYVLVHAGNYAALGGGSSVASTTVRYHFAALAAEVARAAEGTLPLDLAVFYEPAAGDRAASESLLREEARRFVRALDDDTRATAAPATAAPKERP